MSSAHTVGLEPRTSALTILSGPDSVDVARGFLSDLLTGWGVGSAAQNDVDLVASEVIGNFLTHDGSSFITIDAAVGERRHVTVTVFGAPDDASAWLLYPAARSSTSTGDTSGLDTLDQRPASWGIRRQNRRTAIWFTVEDDAPEPFAVLGGDELGRVGATPTEPDEGHNIAAATETDLGAIPEVVAFRAAIVAQGAAAEAAVRTAGEAETARLFRSRQAVKAAAAVAEVAARAVVAAQLEADEAALAVAAAAARAAATVAATVEVDDFHAAAAAGRLAAAVTTAAEQTADQTARAAVLVAQAVTTAAAVAAGSAADEAAAAAQVVTLTADALHAVVTTAAEQLVTDTTEREHLAAVPEVLAFRAAILAHDAAVEAAVRTAGEAETARLFKSRQAVRAAAAIAEVAARAVVATQVEADEVALGVALAAARAAATVAASVEAGDFHAAAAAGRLAAVVTTAAARTADQTARTAVLVAQAVTTAAAVAADTAADEAAAAAEVVSLTADALHVVVTSAAEHLAADTAEREHLRAVAYRENADRINDLRLTNSRLQEAGDHDRAVSVALQQAMHTRLPELPRITLAARYLTASRDDQVGGDWYDALSLAGMTSLIIGDVVGHDIAAAAVMGQLRNLLRALIWNDNDAPSRVVARLDRAARDLRIGTMATMVVVTVDAPTTGRPDAPTTLRWTNAGHPPPILVASDGTTEILDGVSNLLLGVQPDLVRKDGVRVVPAGTTILLYTDGLVETRDDDIDVRTGQLTDSLRRLHHLELEPLLDGVIAEMVGERPGDDVALLAARFQ